MSDHLVKFDWEVTVVEASDIEARVQVRPLAENRSRFGGAEIRGAIIGPYCEKAHTLPARIALRPISVDSVSYGESIIPDPCYWTPELPYLYRVSLECHRGEEILVKNEQMIGLRRAERPVGPAPA